MKKNIDNNEIDLSETILNIIDNKWKVILITLITTFLTTFIFQTQSRNTNEVTFLAKTKIVSNSIFEDYEYQAFNSFVDSLKKKILFLPEQKNLKIKENINDDLKIIDNRNYNIFDNFNYDKINRLLLFKFFIEKLDQKDFFIKSIIEHDLVKKEKFKNDSAYEKAVLKLASSIKIEKIRADEKIQSVIIKFQTSDIEIWEKFLDNIEKKPNQEIQYYLEKKFNLLISNIEKVSDYLIEDIEFEITNNNKNIRNVLALNNIKKRIIENKDIERLKNLFNETPIISSDNFTAAKIKFQSTQYQDITKYPSSIIKIILLSSFLGLLLGIIYVLIANLLQNRR